MPAALLRVATAGSVDDGKSTLLGRLLHDAKGVFEDQFAAVAAASERRGGDFDLALLTDGLRAEREQGITIDVAYRYFASPRRSFLLADTPGHVQYTRNMVTGASTADAAVILVDARQGVTEQSRRHAALASLLRVPHLVLAVNKMDLVGWDQKVFAEVAGEFRRCADSLGVAGVLAVPVSALHGDNIVHASRNAPWYDGPALLEHLESVDASAAGAETGLRFPVQQVVRDPRLDYRGYAGRVAGGTVRRGDDVTVLPSGAPARVAAAECYDGPLDSAGEGQSVVLRLDASLDVARGDLLADVSDAPVLAQEFEATLCWLAQQPLSARRYLLRHLTRTVPVTVAEVSGVLEVSRLSFAPGGDLGLNDIGRARLRAAEPLPLDDYARNRRTGAFVLIDEASGDTVAAGMTGLLPWGEP